MIEKISAWLSIPYVGSVIGIVGVAIAIVTYVLSRPTYRISLHKFTNDLIGLSDSLLPNQVEVLYEGETVSKLASTTFIIWNSGNRVITKSTLETIDPLRITVDGDIKILRYELVKLSNPTCNISTNLDFKRKNINLGFDFLEKNDGVRLKILHTGKNSEINMVGKVIGVKTPSATSIKRKVAKQFFSLFERYLSTTSTPFFYFSIISLFAAVFISTFIWPDEIIRFNELSSAATIWFLRIFVIVNLTTLGFIFGISRNSYPAALKESEPSKEKAS